MHDHRRDPRRDPAAHGLDRRDRSVEDADGAATARQAIGYSIALLLVSVLPPLFGLGSVAYSVAAALCGAAILAASIVFRRERSNRNARRLFMMSNLYLIVVMVLLVL